jgi:hypothetical protein
MLSLCRHTRITNNNERVFCAQFILFAVYTVAFFFCLAYYSTLKMEAVRFSETSVDLIGLHGILSWRIVRFIMTAERTSNLTHCSTVTKISWLISRETVAENHTNVGVYAVGRMPNY